MDQTGAKNALSTSDRVPFFCHNTWGGDGSGEWDAADQEAWQHWWLYIETSHAITGNKDALEVLRERYFLPASDYQEELHHLNRKAFEGLSSVYWMRCIDALPARDRRTLAAVHGGEDLDQIIGRLMIETFPDFNPAKATSFILYMRGVIYPTRLARQPEFLPAGVSRRDKTRTKLVAIAVGELQSQSRPRTPEDIHEYITSNLAWPRDLGRLTTDVIADALAHLSLERTRSLDLCDEIDISETSPAAECEYEVKKNLASQRDLLAAIAGVTNEATLQLLDAWSHWDVARSESAWEDVVVLVTGEPWGLDKTDKRIVRRFIESIRSGVIESIGSCPNTRKGDSVVESPTEPIFSHRDTQASSAIFAA